MKLRALQWIFVALILFGAPFATFARTGVEYEPGVGGRVSAAVIQTDFQWRSAVLRKNAPGVSFRHESFDTYEIVCTWRGEDGRRVVEKQVATKKVVERVASSQIIEIYADSRAYVTGFALAGFTDTRHSPVQVPMVGDLCTNVGGHEGTVTRVDLTGVAEELYATYGDESVLVWSEAHGMQ